MSVATSVPLRVLGDRLLIELEESKYGGYLVIPDSAKDAPQMGRILSVSEELTSEPPALTLHAGQRVIFSRYAGNTLEWKGQKFLAVSRSDIICVVDEDGQSD